MATTSKDAPRFTTTVLGKKVRKRQYHIKSQKGKGKRGGKK